VAALSAWHDDHDAAAEALERVTALPAHVALEVYSVLTRLPGGLAVPAATAAPVLAERFSGKLLELAPSERAQALRTFADSGVFGGAAYDGLVALEAAAHDRTLLTLDRRALGTYQRLGIPFRLIAA
jgi:hypothetical protein